MTIQCYVHKGHLTIEGFNTPDYIFSAYICDNTEALARNNEHIDSNGGPASVSEYMLTSINLCDYTIIESTQHDKWNSDSRIRIVLRRNGPINTRGLTLSTERRLDPDM